MKNKISGIIISLASSLINLPSNARVDYKHHKLVAMNRTKEEKTSHAPVTLFLIAYLIILTAAVISASYV